MGKEKAIEIKHVFKKFANDVKRNMLYGTMSLVLPNSKKRYLRKREFWALNDITTDFYKGEICALIGQNGSGKTTLIRVLSGIYNLEFGQVDTFGHSITPIFAVKAGINPVLSGRENIFYLGSIYGMSRAEIMEKLDYIIAFSELGDFIDMPAGNYSSGMKARLGYTIATATDPDIFVVDEALAVGDVYFRKKCFDQLQEWAEKKNKAIIFVTNNHLKVEKIAQRVVVLKQGSIVMDSRNIEQAMDFYCSEEYHGMTVTHK